MTNNGYKRLSKLLSKDLISCPWSRLHLSLITPERPITVGSPLKGVDDVLIAKILGHSWADRQITSVYNRWDKLPEMREALELVEQVEV